MTWHSLKPQSHQAYDQVTTYLRQKNGPIVERTHDWSQRSYDWSQRSWVIARGKSVAARSWSCSTPSYTGITTRLRPTCDRKMLESWVNRRMNVRLVAEVVRLVAEVVGDRNRQISRNKVDGHVQNWSCHLTIGGTTNRLLTDIIQCGDVSVAEFHAWSYDRSSGATNDRTIDHVWLPLVVRSSPIVLDRATACTTNRTVTYHQQKRPIAACDRFWRS